MRNLAYKEKSSVWNRRGKNMSEARNSTGPIVKTV